MCKPSRVTDIQDYLTTAQVAELTGRTVTTVNRWVTEGRLAPSHQLPGRTGAYLYIRADVDALLAESPGAV